MKRFALFLTLAVSCSIINSQVPQGFNYQAIALDGFSNTPIKDYTLQVKIILLTDTVANTVVWEELHNPVKTNKYGLFSLVVGNGVRQSGSAQSFSDIDWKKAPIYLKTQIYYPNSWKTLGSAKMWSVPYSMVSGSLDGSPGKLEVVGEDVASDEALFEVKRKDGQTMFAVYNHGVRVYMPLDTVSKARKGGFAIGGFSKVKGTVQDYFVVNPDSIRAYIDTNPDKGRKGGFAIGGFDKAKIGNEEYLRVTRDSTRIYLNDTETKARKGGFAIGGFDKAKGNIQDFMTVSTDSVRIYIDDNLVKARKGGFAIGGFDKAKGGNASFLNVATDASGIINPSQNRILWYPLKNAFLTGAVLIEKPDSVGINSFASGYESKAKGNWSQALGYKAIARGDYSTAIGKNAVANYINSFAFGDSARAINNESYAIGRGAVARGYRSFAFGSAGVDNLGIKTEFTQANGDYSFAFGQGSNAGNTGSFAIGTKSHTYADYSLAMGFNCSTMGRGSIAIGVGASTTIGYPYLGLPDYAVAIGIGAKAEGAASTAIGWDSEAYGLYSIAMGNDSKAEGIGSTAIGNGSTTIGAYSISLGNGLANGFGSASLGYQTHASSAYETVVGVNNLDYTPTSTTEWVSTDRLFVIGNGNTTFRNAVTVLKNGNFGIGVDVPIVDLDVNDDIRVGGDIWVVGDIFRKVDPGQGWHRLDDDADTDDAQWYEEPTAMPSDYRLKKEIKPIENAVEKVGKLTGITYYWNDDAKSYFSSSVDYLNAGPQSTEEETLLLREKERGKIYEQFSGQQIGLVAQDVEKVVPGVVHNNKDGYKQIAYGNLVGLLVEAMKEQQQQIESYKSQLKKLQEKVERIEVMLAKGGDR